MRQAKSDEGTVKARAVEYYDALLKDRRLREQTREAIAASTNRRFLYFNDGRPLCTSLRPSFIEEKVYRRALAAGSKIGQAIGIAAVEISKNKTLRSQLKLPDNFDLICERRPKILESALLSRLDGFLDKRGDIHFVECNVNPHGVESGHSLAKMFEELPIMRSFRRRFTIKTTSTIGEVRRAYVTMNERCGGKGLPFVATLFDPSRSTEEGRRRFLFAPDVLHLLADPTALTFERGKVFFDGNRVDVIENIDLAMLARAVPDYPLIDAVRNGAVMLPDGVVGRFFRTSRATFAMLSDESNSSWFSRDLQTAISKHVPWTRVIDDVKTVHRGRLAELVPLIRHNKDNLVLKGDGSFGGSQVVLGWRVDQSAWNAALRRALRSGNWIAQERVPIPSEAFPIMDGQRIVSRRLFQDFNPFVWNGDRAHGALVRVSSSDLLNITSGGGQIPMFVVTNRKRGRRADS